MLKNPPFNNEEAPSYLLQKLGFSFLLGLFVHYFDIRSWWADGGFAKCYEPRGEYKGLNVYYMTPRGSHIGLNIDLIK